jgi:predicted Zn-dependent peptidase
MWDPFGEYEKHVLSNGLSIYCAYWPKRSWIAASCLVHSGAKSDPSGYEGTAHFVEHLISRNQQKSYREIQDYFKNLGGSVELGVTAFNRTYYQFFAPISSDSLPKTLELFGNMLFNTRISDFIEEQRQVIISEFYRSFPTDISIQVAKRRNRNVFKGTWKESRVSPLGEHISISNITQKVLQDYIDHYYIPANTSLVFTGGLKPQEIISLLEASPFFVDKPGERTKIGNPDDSCELPIENLYVFETSKHIQMEKPLVSANFQSICRLPGNIPKFLVFLVRDMLTEALFSELRERRGWSYDIHAQTYNFLQFYEFGIEGRGLPLVAMKAVNNVVNDIINSLASNHKLYEKIINQKIAQYAMYDSSAKSINEEVLKDLETNNRVIPGSEEVELLRNTTLRDVENLVYWLQPERRWTMHTVP